MRARKQRELGGLAAFLILIWIIIGFPTRVNFKLTAATAGFTITTTTKTYFDKHEIYRSNTNNNGTVIQDEEGNQIDILMERNISYYSIPLRETPATVWHTLVAKWSAQRVDMNLHVIEQPLRLLGRGAITATNFLRIRQRNRFFGPESACRSSKWQILEQIPQFFVRSWNMYRSLNSSLIFFLQILKQILWWTDPWTSLPLEPI